MFLSFLFFAIGIHELVVAMQSGWRRYHTKKAWTAMPRFVNWWSWENRERKKGNISAAHAYSAETAMPSSCVRDENFSGFQFTRISITLSFTKMSRIVAKPTAKIVIFPNIANIKVRKSKKEGRSVNFRLKKLYNFIYLCGMKKIIAYKGYYQEFM